VRQIIRVTDVEALEGFCIRATFSDGAVKEVDLRELFRQGGVFEPIRRSRELFSAVRVNHETGTVEWPDEVDLDPEVLYGRFEPASGTRLHRITLREPAAAPG
jgi:Protein of unknown function (DUF2442)